MKFSFFIFCRDLLWNGIFSITKWELIIYALSLFRKKTYRIKNFLKIHWNIWISVNEILLWFIKFKTEYHFDINKLTCLLHITNFTIFYKKCQFYLKWGFEINFSSFIAYKNLNSSFFIMVRLFLFVTIWTTFYY